MGWDTRIKIEFVIKPIAKLILPDSRTKYFKQKSLKDMILQNQIKF